jgi:hypothetical protein
MFSLDFGIAPTVGISSFIILTISIKKKESKPGGGGTWGPWFKPEGDGIWSP